MTRNTTLTTRNLPSTNTRTLDALAQRAPATDDLLQLADWLTTNGAAHLSAVERIELAERLITRRRFITGAGGLLGAAALGACGAGEQAAVPTATVTATRQVEGFYGPVNLPRQPQRIIPAGAFTMDFGLVLDLPLVAGSTLGATIQDYATYQREAYPDVLAKLSVVSSDNYEQIAALQPDCIIDSGSAFDKSRYEKLSQIAPTFVYAEYVEAAGIPDGKPVWREPLRDIGRAFEVEDRAERFLADFDARTTKLREALANRWSDAKFIFMEPNTEAIYVHGTVRDPLGQVLFSDLGVQPAGLVEQNPHIISLELLPEVDADVILLSLRWKEGSLERDLDNVASYIESPLWQRIPAVQKNQVYRFDAELHYISPLCAQAFLDYVERNLLA